MAWLFMAGWLGRSLVARGADRRGGRVADVLLALAFAVALGFGVNRITGDDMEARLDDLEKEYVYAWTYQGGERTEVRYPLYSDSMAVDSGRLVAQCMPQGTSLEVSRDGEVLARWPDDQGLESPVLGDGPG